MWLIIFGAVFLVAIGSVIYLSTRFVRFAFARRLLKLSLDDAGEKQTGQHTKHRRLLGIGIGFAILAIGFTVLLLTMDWINAIICLIHLALIWLVCDGVNVLIFRLRKTQEKTKLYYAGAAALLITTLVLIAAWHYAHYVYETDYELTTQKDIGQEPLRIAMISDSHIGATFHYEEFAKHMERIEDQNPDVLIIAGDFVDDDTTKEDMERCCEILGDLKLEHGIYFVYGNHDKGYYGSEHRGFSAEDLEAKLRENGVVILQDENVLIDQRYYLIGRKDSSTSKDRLSMQELTKDLSSDIYQIVIDHEPQDYAAQAEAGVDLVLSGHTHGGQFFPITYVGEWTGVNDRTYGYELRDKTNYVVSSGISDWAIKFKTGCIAEYVIIDVN